MAMVAAASVGGVAHYRSAKSASAKEVAAKARPAMAAELARAQEGFVLIAGDSHAAALHLPCDSVNVAVGGLKAHEVRAHLAQLPMPVEPSAVLLVVGTNDVLRKQSPLERVDDWVSAVRQVVGRFRKVVVTAIPPVGEELAAIFDPDAILVYSHRLDHLCSGGGCVYADPWNALRSRLFGQARPGALVDGLHVADHTAAVQELADVLCRDQAQRADGVETVKVD
ncbi:SGNH/GDSL hydrolase family protein [Bosea minatitlanensis]|uniref:SGNH/GDSL hydrolase family protein n=1 Tax=Bosea minatitlanensis TaxID=128782 RepID=A0ABW0F8T0_9HYPH|nr:GDSL-type esterase/lipase family protein [Bosea minatitlanensis]